MVVVPADIPLTMPVLLTVAIPVVLLLHRPPIVAFVNDVVPPAHTVEIPVIVPATGNAFTVAVVVATTEPQLLFTE